MCRMEGNWDNCGYTQSDSCLLIFWRNDWAHEWEWFAAHLYVKRGFWCSLPCNLCNQLGKWEWRSPCAVWLEGQQPVVQRQWWPLSAGWWDGACCWAGRWHQTALESTAAIRKDFSNRKERALTETKFPKTDVKSCIWNMVTPCSGVGWGAALQKRMWGPREPQGNVCSVRLWW